MSEHDPVHVLIGAIFVVIILVVILLPYFRIFKRTGHNGWWALLMIVPVANIITLYIIAFSRWPALEEKSAS
jgi:NADH:ubiquinone oxidoreductase subunit 6 (subunit J)